MARDHTVDRAHSRIHVQNAEEHTHGLSAPDLGMGAMRNSIILRSITGREVYPVETSIAFQKFGAPAHDREPTRKHADPAHAESGHAHSRHADHPAQEAR